MKKERSVLKTYFATNKIPKADNFGELIDSGINQAEDGIKKDPANPVSIQAEGMGDGVQDLLYFYKNFNDPAPSWRINQNPRIDAKDPATGKPGLNFSDGTGMSRLFIKSDDGSIGVGTITPGFPLTFGNDMGDKIALWGQSGNHYGFGIQAATLQIYSDSAVSDIAFGYGSSDRLAETMRIKGNGNVGIGTSSPRALLDVAGFIPNKLGSVLGRLEEGNTTGEGTFLGVRGYGTQGNAFGGKGFGIEHSFYGTVNSSINFFRGISTTGGFLTFNTNNNSEKVRITPEGYVGIGTPTPGYALTIAGNEAALGVENRATFSAKNNAGQYEPFLWPRWADNMMYLNFGKAGFNIRNNASSPVMFMHDNGNIGMGTMSPAQKLSVSGDAIVSGYLGIGTASISNEGSRLSGRGALGIRSTNPQIDFLDTDNKQWAIHVNSNKMYFIREPWNCLDLVLDGNGNVGMGTDNPVGKLHVMGAIHAGTSEMYFTDVNHAHTGYGNMPGYAAIENTSNYNALMVLGRMVAGSNRKLKLYDDVTYSVRIAQDSDARIKRQIYASDKVKDIEMLSELKVRDYFLKDTGLSTSLQKGFIAQEVEKVFPEAVVKQTDFIPDIFSQSNSVVVTNNVLTVTMKDAHGLKTNDTVRLITESGNKEVSVIVDSETSFSVGKWEERVTSLFVYGKKVDDFRSVNYNSIFTIGISAIQELYKQLQQLKEELSDVKEKLFNTLIPVI